ncbi:inhibitor of growth protein 3 isoform X2 [Drosophila obscura]|uniref:inhibitor of growth protein 3 isoform X2 n=1 Tax=Drosophila obscura TaxID=7282 RepID=UPI001BB19EF1|nr:inhibitor of growth protein 3 isoform X2 [Drosophila obscura]
MLYLEDYLEMIEHLPQELRDRFTEMRELDLAVQNNMDSLDKKSHLFFKQCKRDELQHESMDTEFHSLRTEYFKVMEDADEKVAIATQIHELVERYLRRLDSELFKFKCELEADNNGITEILERRSLELDGNSTAATALLLSMNQKENRYYGASSINSAAGIITSTGSIGTGPTNLGLPSSGIGSVAGSALTSIASSHLSSSQRHRKLEKRRETICTVPVPEKRANLNHSLPTQLGGGTAASSAIAAAASQAIVATQQMQQGRRTASLKASYEAIHGAGTTADFWSTAGQGTLQTGGAAVGTAQSTLVTAGAVGGAASHHHHQQQQQQQQQQQHHGSSHHHHSSHSGSSHHHHHQDKKQSKKKMSATIATMPASIAVQSALAGSSSGNSIASSSSSMSVDSVDMLSTAAAVLGGMGMPHGSQAMNTAAGGMSASHVTTTMATNVGNVTSAIGMAPTTLVPGSNLNIGEIGLVLEQPNEGEWSYDPNEPRYCTCNQVSYGDMVACDNDACPFEWFHYPCVGITQPPKGKWFCPKCTATMRRRGNRKN